MVRKERITEPGTLVNKERISGPITWHVYRYGTERITRTTRKISENLKGSLGLMHGILMRNSEDHWAPTRDICKE
jgi:hypothetical protein